MEVPNKEKYAALFETTGWNQLYQASSEELARALSNSWHTLSAYDGDLLVGFGRVVSDQVIHAMIYDLIVRPNYQSQGIGGEILGRLVQHCREAGLRDVQLFSASGKRQFYEKRGFSVRTEDAPGMQIILCYKTA